MEEQKLVVPNKKEEGTENGGRDPLIVQVRTLGDFLTWNGTSYLKPESKEEMHQCWDSQWQEFLKSVGGLPIAPPLLEENTDSQASLGRDIEDPREESSGEARGKSVLQRDPSIDGKAWMRREKLDSFVKVEKIGEEVNLESQAPLPLSQFSSQDAEEQQEVSSTQKPKKGDTPNSGGYDANTSQIKERNMGHSEGEASLEKKQENKGKANSLDKMSAKRKSYSVEFKKAIVENSWGKNLTVFCKEKMLDVRMVRKWRAEYENLSQQVEKGNAKKRKCGSGRQPLFPELEGNICEWIADRRAKALVVRRADIQAFALAMAPQLEISPEFKASQHWLDDFLHRYKLSLKKINNIVQAEH